MNSVVFAKARKLRSGGISHLGQPLFDAAYELVAVMMERHDIARRPKPQLVLQFANSEDQCFERQDETSGTVFVRLDRTDSLTYVGVQLLHHLIHWSISPQPGGIPWKGTDRAIIEGFVEMLVMICVKKLREQDILLAETATTEQALCFRRRTLVHWLASHNLVFADVYAARIYKHPEDRRTSELEVFCHEYRFERRLASVLLRACERKTISAVACAQRLFEGARNNDLSSWHEFLAQVFTMHELRLVDCG